MNKPDSATYCPASGKKLRLKDCVAVKFTRVREGESGLYMDPVTMETLTNSSKLVVIAPTGAYSGGLNVGFRGTRFEGFRVQAQTLANS
jgi:hypothetical protein